MLDGTQRKALLTPPPILEPRRGGKQGDLGGGANGEAVEERQRSGAMEKGKEKGRVDGPLHPSWEATKKREQQQQQGKGVAGPFTGKQISFD
jgi:BUD22